MSDRNSTHIEGCILVKPHLYKFICWLENMKPGGLLDLTQSGIVPHTLKMILSYKTNAEFYHKADLSEKYTEVLRYSLPTRAWRRGKMHISKEDMIEFNSHMHTLMHEFILRKCVKYVEDGKFAKEAIEDFLIEIDAEELVHWDSVKRVNQRLRKAKKMPIFYDKSA